MTTMTKHYIIHNDNNDKTFIHDDNNDKTLASYMMTTMTKH